MTIVLVIVVGKISGDAPRMPHDEHRPLSGATAGPTMGSRYVCCGHDEVGVLLLLLLLLLQYARAYLIRTCCCVLCLFFFCGGTAGICTCNAVTEREAISLCLELVAVHGHKHLVCA